MLPAIPRGRISDRTGKRILIASTGLIIRVGLAASLQLIAALPHNPPGLVPLEPLPEFDCAEHPVRMAVLHSPIVQRHGRVAVPTAPGLGIEIDRTALDRFRTA